MARIAILIALAGLLAGCESEEERKAKWVAGCVKGEFSAAQCEVLYSIVKAARDSESSASAAAISSGMAIGIAAGSAGRR